MKRSFSFCHFFQAVLFFFLVGLFPGRSQAQNLQKPSDFEIDRLPLWAKAMYSGSVSAYQVDSLYQAFYRQNLFVKSYHTQYYKRWRKRNQARLNANGFPKPIDIQAQASTEKEYLLKQANDKSSDWSVVGPIRNHQEGGKPGSGQTNVYSLAICETQAGVMYAGTEPGEVYRSTDTARTWKLVTPNLDFGSGVTSVSVHSTNPDFVFAGGNRGLFRSMDGGQTWLHTLVENDLGVNEILHHRQQPNLILAATDKGVFRSTDSGNTWQAMFSFKTYDLRLHPVNPLKMYMVRNKPAEKRCGFYYSENAGQTWTESTNGWFNSTDPARNDGGARIAVSPTDTNRIYAYLIGEAKANDAGFIGVYRSSDGGASWTLPNSPAGGPYTTSHPNLAIGTTTWLYHQGFYNCALMVSPVNPDHILVGGLNLWKSTNGGQTFQAVSGYAGGPLSLHVDNQDFRTQGSRSWISTDGGIYFSENFFQTQPEFRMEGLHGSDYWGFGSGWNEDVLVGGLYHNGNLAYHENYGAGQFLELGGGEAPTGYVNPGHNRRTYFSDIGGKTIPLNLNDPISGGAFGISPNESYFAAESSEMEFHPHCYNIAYVGKDNGLWKTNDGGASFNLVHLFGSAVGNQVKYIEIASSNPKMLYVTQQSASGGAGKLWKTIDEGQNWNTVPLPGGNSRRMLIALDPKNENRIWLAYPDGSNTSKIFTSANGGQNWTNLGSALLNNESIQSLAHLAGTEGGIYVATNKAVYYRTLSTTWQIENNGLPLFTNGNILKPFYRDQKIRLATYGKGIWQSSFTQSATLPIARITVDKLAQLSICQRDSFYFEDYSFLKHAGASWEWSFPTGQPTSSTKRNPSVYFSQDGNHLAVLKIRDANGIEDLDSVVITQNSYAMPGFVQEGFEGDFLPPGWAIVNFDNGAQWHVSSEVGAFGTSGKSAIFDNFTSDSQGSNDDLILSLNASQSTDSQLLFDVAYARWGSSNSDTLVVLASSDCGQTFEELYRRGGIDLATSPDLQVMFLPTASQWRTDSVDLSAYAGQDKLLVAFRNIGRYGNALYLDNLHMGMPTRVATKSYPRNLKIFPNPIPRGSCLQIETTESTLVTVLNMKGQKIKTVKIPAGSTLIDITEEWSAGVYMLQVSGAKTIWNQRVLVR